MRPAKGVLLKQPGSFPPWKLIGSPEVVWPEWGLCCADLLGASFSLTTGCKPAHRPEAPPPRRGPTPGNGQAGRHTHSLATLLCTRQVYTPRPPLEPPSQETRGEGLPLAERMTWGLPTQSAALGFRSEIRDWKDPIFTVKSFKNHKQQFLSTSQSTSGGQGPPLETAYCIKRHFKNSVGTTEVH